MHSPHFNETIGGSLHHHVRWAKSLELIFQEHLMVFRLSIERKHWKLMLLLELWDTSFWLFFTKMLHSMAPNNGYQVFSVKECSSIVHSFGFDLSSCFTWYAQKAWISYCGYVGFIGWEWWGNTFWSNVSFIWKFNLLRLIRIQKSENSEGTEMQQ